VKTIIALAALLLILTFCAGCVTGQSVAQANQATIEEATAPDFYDRGGNACWRLGDMVWCDDGYGSWEDDESQTPWD